MKTERVPSRLILEDGSAFHGYLFGEKKPVSGEVVFNTGMVGYPESLTDPSYKGQILVLTYPLIGNYGVPGEDKEDNILKFFESEQIQIQGLIIVDYSSHYSHWNATISLGAWMKRHHIPGIYGIDTRELTKKLREQGTMLGKILYDTDDLSFDDPNRRNLASEASITKPVIYKKGKKRIVLVDCGTKHNIIRAFLKEILPS